MSNTNLLYSRIMPKTGHTSFAVFLSNLIQNKNKKISENTNTSTSVTVDLDVLP